MYIYTCTCILHIYIYNIYKCYMKVCYLDITSEDRYRKVA